MEPNHSNYQPSSELPHPQEHSEAVAMNVPTEGQLAAPERAATPPAATPTPASQQPLQSVASPPAQPAASAGPIQNDPSTVSTAQLMADDVDLIEKEWVVKAKAIVAQTKDDPYKQNQAMTQVKADYLKKRYNKDLKVTSEN